MKFTIKKEDVLTVLSKVQGLTGRKSNLAITENVLLTTVENGITLIATDLETGMEGSYPANIESTGAIAVNARKLYEIIRDFPEDDICINEVENRWIEIGDDNVQYHLVGMNPEDFPENPHVETVEFFDVDAAFLKKMIEKSVMISAAVEEKRAHINGALLERVSSDEVDGIRMVSTDGSRLSKIDYALGEDQEAVNFEKVLVPKKGLAEVAKFLSGEGVVRIGIQNNYFIVRRNTETIIIRLLEGQFPQYGDIIRKKDASVIALDRMRFLMMLKRMSILASEHYRGTVFAFGDNRLTVRATNPELGESKEYLSIAYEGAAIKPSFNPRFFIEVLNVIEDDQILLYIDDEEKPCVVEGQNDKRYVCVIMPMRI